jgi:hypothetical protein
MRTLCVVLAIFLSMPAAAQQALKKKKQVAHKKPTPEQVRKFNELQKKKR